MMPASVGWRCDVNLFKDPRALEVFYETVCEHTDSLRFAHFEEIAAERCRTLGIVSDERNLSAFVAQSVPEAHVTLFAGHNKVHVELPSEVRLYGQAWSAFERACTMLLPEKWTVEFGGGNPEHGGALLCDGAAPNKAHAMECALQAAPKSLESPIARLTEKPPHYTPARGPVRE
jgi:hypothetical protein